MVNYPEENNTHSKNEKKYAQALKKKNILRSRWEILFWKAVIQKHLGSVVETSSQCNTAVKTVNLVLENKTNFNRRENIYLVLERLFLEDTPSTPMREKSLYKP